MTSASVYTWAFFNFKTNALDLYNPFLQILHGIFNNSCTARKKSKFFIFESILNREIFSTEERTEIKKASSKEPAFL